MITAGQQILHYRIEEKLGEGGMGVVWRATDSTLGRSVAIKFLPPAFAADPERLARFEREARVLAALNHPNIATVYSVHLVGAERCLTMELVPGEDLAQRIGRGPVPIPEALEIARQIALALEAAHENSVVHRDLKPANVRLTPDGRVKVLDFGLAKALEGSAPAAALSQSPTLVGSMMGSGTIIGTAAYMSPEQARGQSADRRSDIWAFGVVLYEMLTAQRAFDGETVSDTLAGVLRAEPDRARLPAGLPLRIRRLIDRCLEKSPRARLRDIGEALLVIEAEQAGRPDSASEPSGPPARASAGRERMLWAGGLLAAVVTTAAMVAALRPAHAPSFRKLTLSLRDEAKEIHAPVISPDGRQIAYLLARKLCVRDLTQLTSRTLAEGLDEDFRPVWSPDGRFIAFGGTGGLSRVSVATGAISPICAVDDFSGGSGGTWGADGRLLFAKGHNHIYSVPAGGGVPVVYLAREDSLDADLHNPHQLPGGRGLLYVRHLTVGGPNTLALAVNDSRRDLFRLPTGFIYDPVYDPRGYIVFSRLGEGAGLWALPFSLGRLQVTGEPFLLAPGGSSPSLAGDGNLLYGHGMLDFSASVVLVSRSGQILETLTPEVRGCWSMALSPDGKRLAMEDRVGGEGDVWVYDLERKAQTRFAFGPGRQAEPAWSPDGRELAWNAFGEDLVLAKASDGSTAPRVLASGFLQQYTPDGRHLVYSRVGVNGSDDIWYRSLDGSPDSVEVIATGADESFAMPSPHGRYLLYQSGESGRAEVYLRQYPTGGGRWQVSTLGGSKPLWSRRGDRIYYWAGEVIFEVPIELEPAVRLGTPRALFNLGDLKMQSWGRHNFLPTPHPDQFLMLHLASGVTESNTDAILVENWPAEFGRPK